MYIQIYIYPHRSRDVVQLPLWGWLWRWRLIIKQPPAVGQRCREGKLVRGRDQIVTGVVGVGVLVHTHTHIHIHTRAHTNTHTHTHTHTHSHLSMDQAWGFPFDLCRPLHCAVAHSQPHLQPPSPTHTICMTD